MIAEPTEVSHGVEGKQDSEGVQLPNAALHEELSRKRGWAVQVWNEPLHKWPQCWAGNRANGQQVGMDQETWGCPHPLRQTWQVLPTCPCWLMDWELLWNSCRQILQLGQHGCGMVLWFPQKKILSQDDGLALTALEKHGAKPASTCSSLLCSYENSANQILWKPPWTFIPCVWIDLRTPEFANMILEWLDLPKLQNVCLLLYC